jgi:hypothetical protein
MKIIKLKPKETKINKTKGTSRLTYLAVPEDRLVGVEPFAPLGQGRLLVEVAIHQNRRPRGETDARTDAREQTREQTRENRQERTDAREQTRENRRERTDEREQTRENKRERKKRIHNERGGKEREFVIYKNKASKPAIKKEKKTPQQRISLSVAVILAVVAGGRNGREDEGSALLQLQPLTVSNRKQQEATGRGKQQEEVSNRKR